MSGPSTGIKFNVHSTFNFNSPQSRHNLKVHANKFTFHTLLICLSIQGEKSYLSHVRRPYLVASAKRTRNYLRTSDPGIRMSSPTGSIRSGLSSRAAEGCLSDSSWSVAAASAGVSGNDAFYCPPWPVNHGRNETRCQRCRDSTLPTAGYTLMFTCSH